MMSGYKEDLDDFSTENPITKAESMLGHFARKRQMNGQLQLESLQNFHHFLMGQLLGSNMRS